jgi:hypothetical protein
MKQYTQENCNKAEAVFGNHIDQLKTIGQNASDQSKFGILKTAVLLRNNPNNQIEWFIETGERKDLCDLIDQITIAAGPDPKNYADGEGVLDEWRDW